MIRRSAILRDTGLLAVELSDLSKAALEAVACLAESKAPPAGWREAKLTLLSETAKPKPAGVEFAILPSVKQLVVAASELPKLRGESPVEWQRRVKTLASGEQTR